MIPNGEFKSILESNRAFDKFRGQVNIKRIKRFFLGTYLHDNLSYLALILYLQHQNIFSCFNIILGFHDSNEYFLLLFCHHLLLSRQILQVSSFLIQLFILPLLFLLIFLLHSIINHDGFPPESCVLIFFPCLFQCQQIYFGC